MADSADEAADFDWAGGVAVVRRVALSAASLALRGSSAVRSLPMTFKLVGIVDESGYRKVDTVTRWDQADVDEWDQMSPDEQRALAYDLDEANTQLRADRQTVVAALLETQELLMEAGQERGHCLGCGLAVADHRPADTPDCPMTRITAVLAEAVRA